MAELSSIPRFSLSRRYCCEQTVTFTLVSTVGGCVACWRHVCQQRIHIRCVWDVLSQKIGERRRRDGGEGEGWRRGRVRKRGRQTGWRVGWGWREHRVARVGWDGLCLHRKKTRHEETNTKTGNTIKQQPQPNKKQNHTSTSATGAIAPIRMVCGLSFRNRSSIAASSFGALSPASPVCSSEDRTATAMPALRLLEPGLPHPLRPALPKPRLVWQAIGRQDRECRLYSFLLLLLLPLPLLLTLPRLFSHPRHSELVHRKHPNLSLHLAQHPPLVRPVKRVAEAQLPCFEPLLLHERPCTPFQSVERFDQAMLEQNKHSDTSMNRLPVQIHLPQERAPQVHTVPI
ncbi:hypothetical protein BLNAU_15224 [Blattamonas nauphoetae]|uniref:Uncharacterized protein n=1 Tax=Blattamonas nauphoetae TaxID=2049346 RepID=A0ABQ9XEJ5_9EUKA|nr:hypothetical protein BLNAU_24219 [Blattamonas nauphoetae]KAK2949829.1 hypothetical protein BLNAU_15224 [Blattamonas nauphoetae]